MRKFLIWTFGFLIGLPLLTVISVICWFSYLEFVYGRPECTNTNDVFADHSPESPQYKNELINQLKENEDLKTKYWLKGYVDTNHIEVYVQNEKLCAIAHVTVDKWPSRLQNFRRVKGRSYNIGFVDGLKLEYAVAPGSAEIKLKSLSGLTFID